MEIRYNAPLAPYTSFYIGGPADTLVFAESEDDVMEAVRLAREQNQPLKFLGGGSNVLIADEGYRGMVVVLENIGLEIVRDDDNEIVIEVAAGEKWDDIVKIACTEGYWGIENLSWIPGTVGGFPIQNVGAYGQEASQVIEYIKVLNRETLEIETLGHTELQFGYRTSILNQTHQQQYVVLSCALRLSKTPAPNLSYKDLQEHFLNNPQPSLMEIREAVIAIRDNKFPFPTAPQKGSAGSFFRGPVLTPDEFNQLLKQIAGNLGQEASDKLQSMKAKLQVAQGYKTPAAFLLDVSNVKGLSEGGAKINEVQPAVILNYTGSASASDVIKLYQKVRQIVKEQTGVTLSHEPEFIGFSEPLD